MTIKKNVLVIFALFFFVSVFLVFFVTHKPICDFGNYYYGSRILLDGGKSELLYSNIHWFNEQIKAYGEKDFFENYIPVPPFSLVFYYPFTAFESGTAKLIFNLLSVLILYFSLWRFIKSENKFEAKYLIGLAALFVPLYNNIVQGQSYLIIAALLLEIYMARKKQNFLLIGCFIALLFHLKIFPSLVLLYFLIRKDYKAVLWGLAMIVALFLITAIILGRETVINYYTGILPRLFRNEISDPFYYGHQSVNIFFKNLFTFDFFSNPSPLVDFPLAGHIFEGILTGLIIYFAFTVVKKAGDFGTYSTFIFLMFMLNKYIPSYALVILLPFILYLPAYGKGLLALILLFIACNLPLSLVSGAPLLIKYFRMLLMLTVILIILKDGLSQINYFAVSLLVVFFITISVFTNSASPNFYLTKVGKEGVYYDMNVLDNNLVLKRCMGSIDYLNTLKWHEQVKSVITLQEHPLLLEQRQQVKKIFLINDNTLVYLSDLNQGVGIFKPRIQKLR